MKPAQGIRMRYLSIAAGLLALAWVGAHAALTPEELRGKQIYAQGSSVSGGDITAFVGAESVALPASAVPCASCHGADGLGRPEGGVIPPDIRWNELTKVYGHVHSDGRRHPAFDEDQLARLITTGIDPGGNRLDQAMPLYRMSERDMADLVAYLKRLETDRDPGVKDDRIQVATLLPLSGPRGTLGQAMAQVLHAHFQEVNAHGGIFGRRLELLVIPFGTSSEDTLDNLRLAVEREGIFALVGAYTVGMDQELLRLLRDEGMPLVGPFTLDPGDEVLNAATFYLYAGFKEQARVLAETALRDAPDGEMSAVLAGPLGEHVDRLVKSVQDQLEGRTVTDPEMVRYPADGVGIELLAGRMAESNPDTLFFFGGQSELQLLLAAFAERQQSPRVYLLSSFVPQPLFDAPPTFHHRIFIAYPTLGSDISGSGRSEYEQLAHKHALPPDHLQGQIAAYAAAKLMVEGLRRAGRDLNRQGLIDALEELYAYETGVTPPLSYGPNRRVGARGAHVVAVDLIKKSYNPVGGWHELR